VPERARQGKKINRSFASHGRPYWVKVSSILSTDLQDQTSGTVFFQYRPPGRQIIYMSAYEPSGPSDRCLSPVSVTWSDYPGHEPGPSDPESCVLAMRPPSLHSILYKSLYFSSRLRKSLLFFLTVEKKHWYIQWSFTGRTFSNKLETQFWQKDFLPLLS